jgi:hypothetical protein
MSDPCSNFKFYRQSEIKWYHKIWNHWLNPFGNWHEPLCYPMKRLEDYKTKDIFFGLIPARWIPETIYWTILRNPLHNLTHFWLGITPLGERYEWISPECRGWSRTLEDFSWQDLETEGFEWELWSWEPRHWVPVGAVDQDKSPAAPRQYLVAFIAAFLGGATGTILGVVMGVLAAIAVILRNYQFKFWFRLFGSVWNGYIGTMSRGNFGAAFRK